MVIFCFIRFFSLNRLKIVKKGLSSVFVLEILLVISYRRDLYSPYMISFVVISILPSGFDSKIAKFIISESDV